MWITAVRPAVTSGAFAPRVGHLFPGHSAATGVTCVATDFSCAATGIHGAANGTRCVVLIHVLF